MKVDVVFCVGMRRTGRLALASWYAGNFCSSPWVVCTDYPRWGLSNYFPEGHIQPETILLDIPDTSVEHFFAKIRPDVMANLNNQGYDIRTCSDLLFLRDPFNLAASRAFHPTLGFQDASSLEFDAFMALWKDHASYFWQRERNSNTDPVNQIFDGIYWIDALADAQYSVIPPAGGGSTFDGFNFRRNATGMDVYGRWKALDPAIIAKIASDKFAMEYYKAHPDPNLEEIAEFLEERAGSPE